MHITKNVVQYFTKHFERLEFIHDNDLIRNKYMFPEIVQ